MDLERFARNQPVTKGMSTEMNSRQEGRGLSAEKAVFLCVCYVPLLCLLCINTRGEVCRDGRWQRSLQPAVLLPQGAGGVYRGVSREMAEIGHPGQVGALRDAPRAVSPLNPIPYV